MADAVRFVQAAGALSDPAGGAGDAPLEGGEATDVRGDAALAAEGEDYPEVAAIALVDIALEGETVVLGWLAEAGVLYTIWTAGEIGGDWELLGTVEGEGS